MKKPPTEQELKKIEQFQMVEDERVQIKRHRGRGKLELYVHCKALREALAASPLIVPVESPDETKQHVLLKKKVLFRSSEYGDFLQSVLQTLAKSLQEPEKHQVFLEKWKLCMDSETGHQQEWQAVSKKFSEVFADSAE